MRSDAGNAALGVLKHGIGYDLVVNHETRRLVLGIRYHTCGRTSYQPKDVEERYCGACKKFHDDGPGQIA
jgi:hypothetical protein